METLKLVGSKHKVLLVKDDVVKFVDLGGLFSSMKKEKLISVYDIVGVEVKKPDMYKGYIQIQIAGQVSPNSSRSSSGSARANSTYSAMDDENSVVFSGDDNYQIALAMQKHIQGMIAKSRVPTAAFSPADELLKFKSLLDSGAISQEEFDAKKKELLGL